MRSVACTALVCAGAHVTTVISDAAGWDPSRRNWPKDAQLQPLSYSKETIVPEH